MNGSLDKKRIALFMAPLLTHGGGAEKYFIELAKNLANKEFIVDIITFDRDFYKKFSNFLSLVYFKKIKPIERETEEAINNQLDKARWLKISPKNLKNILNNYDIIYSKNEITDLFLLKFFSGKKMPPIIVGVHTPIFYPITKSLISKLHNFLYLGFIYKILLNKVKCIHLSNKFTKDLVDKKFKIDTELIYYPFSTTNMKDKSISNICELKFSDNKINVIFIARLTEQKGIDILINIIKNLSNINNFKDKFVINIFGSGDLENEIIKLSKKYSFIKYFGHIENKYVPNILSKNDLFISTAKWETLPFNILEAQSLGLPTIAFNIPGPSDIIVNNETGYLVNDEKEFLERIINFNKNNFNSINIIDNIDKKFRPDFVYNKLIEMFKKNI